MGTEPSQALTLICDYDKSKFYIVSVAVDELEILDVPADLEWAMIVAYHRGRMEKIKKNSQICPICLKNYDLYIWGEYKDNLKWITLQYGGNQWKGKRAK